MKNRILIALALSTAVAAAPALAQRSVATYGDYTDVTDVKILPGHFEEYMDFLKANWLKEQAWAKSKGYITGYSILANTYPREHEATVYLLTSYKTVPTNAEIERRQSEYVAMMKMDEHQMDSAAEKRGPIRTILGQAQLQEIILK